MRFETAGPSPSGARGWPPTFRVDRRSGPPDDVRLMAVIFPSTGWTSDANETRSKSARATATGRRVGRGVRRPPIATFETPPRG